MVRKANRLQNSGSALAPVLSSPQAVSLDRKHATIAAIESSKLDALVNEWINKHADLTNQDHVKILTDIWKAKLNAYPRETASKIQTQAIPFALDAALQVPEEKLTQAVEVARAKRLKEEETIRTTITLREEMSKNGAVNGSSGN